MKTETLWKAGTAATLALTLPWLGACSSSNNNNNNGGPQAQVADEVEPNNDSTTATTLALGTYGFGDLVTIGDVDCWSVNLTANRTYQVEVVVNSLDQGTWDTEGNQPELTILAADGTTVLRKHDLGQWSWGDMDLGLPCFLAETGGTHFICMGTADILLAGGQYAVRMTQIQNPSNSTEMEAVGVMGDNDDFTTAEPLSPGVVLGWHVDDENDYYSFNVPGPGVAYFEYKGYRMGISDGASYFDPELYLYDTDGTTELISNDDAFFYDSAFVFKFDTAGTYFVNATECCDEGDGPYLLTYTWTGFGGANSESEPNDDTLTATGISYGNRVTANASDTDTDYYSFTGSAGDRVRMFFYDADTSQGSASFISVDLLGPDEVTSVAHGYYEDDLPTLIATLQADGTHYIEVSGTAATDYCFTIERYQTSTPEVEPNNSLASAGALGSSGRVFGIIALPPLPPPGVSSDEDWYSVNLQEDEVATFAVYANGTESGGEESFSDDGSSLDAVLSVYYQSEIVTLLGGPTLLGRSDRQSGPSTESLFNATAGCQVTVRAPQAGTYYIQVRNSTGIDSANEFYVLEQL